MSAHTTITDIAGIRILIGYAEGAENPRTETDWAMATIACRDDHRHYTFGDEDSQFDIARIVDAAIEEYDELVEDAAEGEDIGVVDPRTRSPWAIVRDHLVTERGAIEATLVGLSMTDHGSHSYEVDVPDGSKGMGGNFYMGMDSAFIGWAYVTRAAAEAAGHEDVDVATGITGAGYNLRDAAIAEAREWASWATGDVHYYVIEDAVTGETLDNCWGLIGYKYAEETAREEGEALAAQRAAELAELIYRAQVDLDAAFELARYEAAAAAHAEAA